MQLSKNHCLSSFVLNGPLQHTPCWKTKQYNLSPGKWNLFVMQQYFIVLSSNMALWRRGLFDATTQMRRYLESWLITLHHSTVILAMEQEDSSSRDTTSSAWTVGLPVSLWDAAVVNYRFVSSVYKRVSRPCAERTSEAPKRGLASLAGHTLF